MENINKKIGSNDEMNMDLEFNLIFFSISLIKLVKDNAKIPDFGSQKKKINVFVLTTKTFIGFNFNIFKMMISSPYLERMENPTLL